MRLALSRLGERPENGMPNDQPELPGLADRDSIRRTRAARCRVRRLGLGDPLDVELVQSVAGGMSPTDIDAEIASRTEETDEAAREGARDRAREAIRHEVGW